MHLLTATSAPIGEGDEAIDLNQPPAETLILSAADSELAALAAARAALGAEAPELRLASLLLLRHHMSVDLWLEKTAQHAKVIVARVLGGHAYWPYGVEELQRLAHERGIHLALLPGGHVQDEELMGRSTLPMEVCEALRGLFVAGGVENARRVLLAAKALCALPFGAARAEQVRVEPPLPFPTAGVWLDGEVITDIAALPRAKPEKPLVPVVFYRALLEGGFTAPVSALAEALREKGMAPLPVFVSSLKDASVRTFLRALFAAASPSVIIDTTAFAAGEDDPLRGANVPVLQAFFTGASEAAWRENPQGLGPRDLAMLVSLPELDGRVITRAASFKEDDAFDEATHCRLLRYEPHATGISRVAGLAARYARLRALPNHEKRIALVLANYPNRDGRIGNGVGLDTPASAVNVLRALKEVGYDVARVPEEGDTLIRFLQAGPTNARPENSADFTFPLETYLNYFNALPEEARKPIQDRWGAPQDDPFFRPGEGAFAMPARKLGEKVVCAIQPARGYNIDPKATYHDAALPPPHGYLAFYFWLREHFGADAIVHVGKHGNLEWLPGKALALSEACFPDAVLPPMPHFYPFIVNDPGEGAQAKRRTAAVIIDHLMPPLVRAETHGALMELERLVDEYWQAAGMDAPRAERLREDIILHAVTSGIAEDAGVAELLREDPDEALALLDAWLCDLKEAQIRGGLHILGEPPGGGEVEALAETLVALARMPRGDGTGENASLIEALANDLLPGFSPFDAPPAAPYEGARPALLARISDAPWRTNADARERLELRALELAKEIATGTMVDSPGPASAAVLEWMSRELLPKLHQSAHDEIANLLKGLNGQHVPPGPSGAPSRGRPDVLPTGRNFYSLDARALPTPAAWDLGRRSAENMIQRHFMEHGEYPRAIGLSCWGTSNMRTGGDDIAQALALIGAKPEWDHASGRVVGFSIMPLAELGRPRVDVTLRISGFFRDAFPQQIELFDRAIRAVGALDEPEEDNPIAARMRAEHERLLREGWDAQQAERMAGYRIFGAAAGAYGAGLQALFDENLWETQADLAETWIDWGAHAYGAHEQGAQAKEALRRRLASLDAVAHNQDNREHDVLDSDDYYQFEGGFAVAAKHVKGKPVPVWHNDHSRPERPVTRSLEEEIARVVRTRATNPKWISAMMRHGYKGAFELSATLDYMFAFAATTGAVKSHHFEAAYEAWLKDEEVRQWLEEHNPHALLDMAARFEEAMARGFWRPRANDAPALLDELRKKHAKGATG